MNIRGETSVSASNDPWFRDGLNRTVEPHHHQAGVQKCACTRRFLPADCVAAVCALDQGRQPARAIDGAGVGLASLVGNPRLAF